MVVNYMVNHHQLIYANKYNTLMSLYGVEEDAPDPGRGWVVTPFLQGVPQNAAVSQFLG